MSTLGEYEYTTHFEATWAAPFAAKMARPKTYQKQISFV